MVNRRELDPTESVAALYGYKLRQCRDARGLTGAALGDALNYSPDLISKIELGTMAASLEFSERAAAFFDTDVFLDLQPHAARDDLPSQVGRFAKLEAKATEHRLFGLTLPPGLLQCEETTRELVATEMAEREVEGLVKARVERQAIFDRASPPTVWAVITEYAFLRCIGSEEVRTAQLKHYLELIRRKVVFLQILPEKAPIRPTCGFVHMRFDHGPDIAHMDVPSSGELFGKQWRTEAFMAKFDRIRAEAWPCSTTAEMIRSQLEAS